MVGALEATGSRAGHHFAQEPGCVSLLKGWRGYKVVEILYGHMVLPAVESMPYPIPGCSIQLFEVYCVEKVVQVPDEVTGNESYRTKLLPLLM